MPIIHPTTSKAHRYLHPRLAMPIEVPYAADAEISLTYDELEVRLLIALRQ
jgi:hypothetical protein